jgi:hypothetical protein
MSLLRFAVRKIKTELRHTREWVAVLREEQREINLRTVLRMIRGLFSRPVAPAVARQRLRVCRGCMFFDRQFRRCRGPWLHGHPTGCGCYIVWLVRVPRPYWSGCWSRTAYRADYGWGLPPGSVPPGK